MNAIRTTTRRHWRAAAAVVLLGTLAAAPQAHAAAARYQLDPEHITMGFLVEHLGYAKVLGMFRAARGSYSFDEETGALSDVRIEVDTRSVFTNHAKRDQHLMSADFLNVNEFPRMVFTAGSARKTGERSYEIAGQLELVGRSQPLTLTATWNKSGASPIDKTYVMGVSARGSFKRSSYGIKYGVDNGWVGDDVPLIVEFEAKRQ
ncbi:MAG: YceI family protein [Proteobacteria bacterium]|nr:YceI family protein [Pseudomonadota bacterium]